MVLLAKFTQTNMGTGHSEDNDFSSFY